MAGRLRRADPWRDTDVIDERAPRFNQAIVALVAAAGVVFGWPLAWALMGAQLGIGLAFGRRWCLPCLAYFVLVQPRIGEGRLEDSRPPRLANAIGTVFLGGAAASWWLGAPALGTALGAVVAGLAGVAALSGFCAGCQMYRLLARIRGIKARGVERLDPAELAALGSFERAYVEFTHPLCGECQEWEDRLSRSGVPSVSLDVRARPELARRYGIHLVPTVIAVDSGGRVLERLVP